MKRSKTNGAPPTAPAPSPPQPPIGVQLAYLTELLSATIDVVGAQAVVDRMAFRAEDRKKRAAK